MRYSEPGCGDNTLELYEGLIQFKEMVLISKGITKYPYSPEVILEIIVKDINVKREGGKVRL